MWLKTEHKNKKKFVKRNFCMFFFVAGEKYISVCYFS